MSDMADVLLAHSSASYECDYDGQGTNGIWCDQCGEGQDDPGEPEDGWLAQHQADMLTAAGFGPVQAARAEVQDDAWKRGYDACREGQQRHSPYREASS